MKNTLLFILFLGCCLFLTACRDKECPTLFYIPFETFPYQRTYKVGDTITVRSRFHKMVDGFDSANKKLGTYDMSGIKWRPLFDIVNIDSVTQYFCLNKQIDVYIPSTFSKLKLKQYSLGYYVAGDFNFENEHFELELKFIPKVAGKFFMINHNGVDAINPQEFPGMCRRNGWNCYWNMNKGKDNNQNLLDNAPAEENARYGTGSKPFFWHGNFCFEVVD